MSRVMRLLTIASDLIRSKPLQVFVRESNIDRALKMLKRKMQSEGVFREMRQHRFYEKPTEKKTRQRAEGIRHIRKPHESRLCATD
jgi:ribosomal protein S21